MKSHMFFGNQYKKAKIIHNGKIIGRFNADGRKYTFMGKVDNFMIRWTKRLGIVAFILGVFTGGLKIGNVTIQPRIVSAQVTNNVEVMPAIPVLDRIASCESGGSQYDKNGQVITNANTNGSVDLGKYQINITIWGKTAHTMGLDLSKESDNTKFAQWLFLNKGSGAWVDSSKCWNK